MVDPRIISGRDRVWKVGVIHSEIRSRPSLTALCLCFCTLHTNEIPRIDPLVQIDYVRVVDLDIGASKSDNQLLLGLNDNGLRDARSACAECEKKRDDFKGRANPAKVRDRSVSQHD